MYLLSIFGYVIVKALFTSNLLCIENLIFNQWLKNILIYLFIEYESVNI